MVGGTAVLVATNDGAGYFGSSSNPPVSSTGGHDRVPMDGGTALVASSAAPPEYQDADDDGCVGTMMGTFGDTPLNLRRSLILPRLALVASCLPTHQAVIIMRSGSFASATPMALTGGWVMVVLRFTALAIRTICTTSAS